MNQIEIEERALIPASAEEIIAVLRDYNTDHPAILPRQYFKSLKVIKGGIGAGTQVEIQMNVFGAARVFLVDITEPEPGRSLLESDAEQGVKTLFVVEPKNEGEHAQVTIISRAKTSSGLMGTVEKVLNPLIFRRIFRTELNQLANYMRENKGS